MEKSYKYRIYPSAKDMKQRKAELRWLKEADSTALQSSLKDLENAYQKFFQEYARFPKFKSKKTHRYSYQYKMCKL